MGAPRKPKESPETLQWSLQQRLTGFTLHVTFGKEPDAVLIPYVKALAIKGCQLKEGFDFKSALHAALATDTPQVPFDPLQHEGMK